MYIILRNQGLEVQMRPGNLVLLYMYLQIQVFKYQYFFGYKAEFFLFQNNPKNLDLSRKYSLASRLNGYMYSNGKSLNMALFILMANHLAWGLLF